MLDILLWTIVLIISLAVLIKAADYFTQSSEKIGLFFGLSTFIIGVTFVSIGTSLPELITSIFAVLRNSSEIVVGAVIGSNITNIFLVLGIAAIVGKKLQITRDITLVDLPLLMSSAFLLAITIYDGKFTFIEALLFIAAIVIFLLYTLKTEKKKEIAKAEVRKLKEKKKKFDWKILIVFIVSCFFIYIGAKYTVESIIKLADILNIGKDVIALSAIALGTSLPELVVCITAVRKGKHSLAVGNVLGSSVFNTFAVMGIPALIGTLTIPASIITFGLPMMLIATLLFFFMTQSKVVTKWEGWILLIFYVFFIGKLFGWL